MRLGTGESKGESSSTIKTKTSPGDVNNTQPLKKTKEKTLPLVNITCTKSLKARIIEFFKQFIFSFLLWTKYIGHAS